MRTPPRAVDQLRETKSIGHAAPRTNANTLSVGTVRHLVAVEEVD
jgi:hypothetical protein